MKFCLLMIAAVYLALPSRAQSGCTDPNATNYNPSAVSNDGSCSFPATSVALTAPKALPVALNESSALTYTDGGLWTLADSGNNPKIFRISEADGSILQTVTVTNASNIDWEELTADDDYFYIGDFGNNASGDRTDLTVYRVAKTSIGSAATVNVTASIISFTYPDQVITGPSAANATRFDCEAFLIKDNTLHLFTKDYISGHSQHYSLPSAPGSYVATKLDEFDVQGLITGASLSAGNEIILLGYSTSKIDLFAWLLYDYTGTNFFSGNKRKLDLGHSIDFANRSNDKGQTEGITFTSNGVGYVSSEKIDQTIFGTHFVVPARLYSFSVASMLTLPVHLVSFTVEYRRPEVSLTWQTASESNSAYYIVQRSGDGNVFERLQTVTAAGSSNQLLTYTYIDRHPLTGVGYYRLLQTDIDGRQTTSATRAVRVTQSDRNILSVSSGASFDQIVVNIGSDVRMGMGYRVIDMNGRTIMQGVILSRQHSLYVSALPSGVYVLKLNTGQQVKFIR